MAGNLFDNPTMGMMYRDALQSLYNGAVMPWDREILAAAPLPADVVDPFASEEMDPRQVMGFAYNSLMTWVDEAKKANYFSKHFTDLSKLVLKGVMTMGRGLMTLHYRGESLDEAPMQIGDLISVASYHFRKSYLGVIQTAKFHPEISERLLLNQLSWTNMLMRLYKTKEKLAKPISNEEVRRKNEELAAEAHGDCLPAAAKSAQETVTSAASLPADEVSILNEGSLNGNSDNSSFLHHNSSFDDDSSFDQDDVHAFPDVAALSEPAAISAPHALTSLERNKKSETSENKKSSDNEEGRSKNEETESGARIEEQGSSSNEEGRTSDNEEVRRKNEERVPDSEARIKDQGSSSNEEGRTTKNKKSEIRNKRNEEVRRKNEETESGARIGEQGSRLNEEGRTSDNEEVRSKNEERVPDSGARIEDQGTRLNEEVRRKNEESDTDGVETENPQPVSDIITNEKEKPSEDELPNGNDDSSFLPLHSSFEDDLPPYIQILRNAFGRSEPNEEGRLTFTFDEIRYLASDPDFAGIYPDAAADMRRMAQRIDSG